ncbi:LpxI family protein [Tateyamaria sp.]|uniref:LpxI family protein n=1 Tax=Tateyamaria sp. TaxID=1929288 RepID=UPI003B217028
MLALIAGRGALPAAVAAAQTVVPVVCTLEGHVPEGLAVDLSFRIERLGTFLNTLKKKWVTEVCFCGAIDRPQLDPSQIDAATMPLVPVLAAALGSGEDGALRAAIGVFEQAGFAVRAAHALAPDLIPPVGVLTTTRPGDGAEADVAVALRVLAAQGAADLGQACVVQNGSVRAREDASGTDAMLVGLGRSAPPLMGDGDPVSGLMDMAGDMLGEAADWLSGEGAKPLLFKGPKPDQDIRVDLPTIGPQTARNAVSAGLGGIVIVAGGVLVLDRAGVIQILNDAGLYLWVR